MKNYDKKLDKKELIDAARVAMTVPQEKEFWRQVEKRMALREKSVVTPRPKK